jgi:hydroxymethylbilane synthase
LSRAASAAVLRLATRGSALALAQTELVAAALQQVTWAQPEPLVVRTLGDRRDDVPLERLEGQGWFTRELERSLLSDNADVAVHSAKDLPTATTPGLVIAAYLARGDARDGVVTRDGCRLNDLPDGAVVATSSARRVAMLQALHPRLRTCAIRGNVDTRVRKLHEGACDALLLACAGLERLGRRSEIAEALDPNVFVPAPAQGVIAVQCRDDAPVRAHLEALDDGVTRAAVTAERSVLAALGGGCLLPLGAWARVHGDQMVLTAALAADGTLQRAETVGVVEDAEALGREVARRLR